METMMTRANQDGSTQIASEAKQGGQLDKDLVVSLNMITEKMNEQEAIFITFIRVLPIVVHYFLTTSCVYTTRCSIYRCHWLCCRKIKWYRAVSLL